MTHLVMTPVQCLARIAALIPPPRFPLQRFSGVFAPRSPLRAAAGAERASGESRWDADVAAREDEAEGEEDDADCARRRVAVGRNRGGDVARARKRRAE